MSALRECPVPWCGGQAEMWCEALAHSIRCSKCGLTTAVEVGNHEAAIAAWNRRAGDAEVEKLRAELAAARDALRGWIEARDALFEYERKYPNSSGREWTRLFDAAALAEDAARAALGDTP